LSGIPAYCISKDCGYIFLSGAFFVSNATNITLKGNTTSCPKCGSDAAIVDGVFNFSEGVPEVISAPEITHSKLSQLKEIASQLGSSEVDISEILAQVDKVDSVLGATLRKGWTLSKNIAHFLAFFFAVLASVNSLVDSKNTEEFQKSVLLELRKLNHSEDSAKNSLKRPLEATKPIKRKKIKERRKAATKSRKAIKHR
jgi:hypothetical protein